MALSKMDGTEELGFLKMIVRCFGCRCSEDPRKGVKGAVGARFASSGSLLNTAYMELGIELAGAS